MEIENYPVFDAHLHFPLAFLDSSAALFHRCGIQGGINLWSGAYEGFATYRQDYAEYLRVMRDHELGRQMLSIWWPSWHLFAVDPDRFVREMIERIPQYAALGCRGLKVWKDLGMFDFFADNTPTLMDDPRLEPVWQACAAVGWLVAIHQADPSNNFRARCRTRIPREDLFAHRDQVIAAHPGITFILCHDGNDPESAARFTGTLDRFSNVLYDLCFRPKTFATPAEARDVIERYAGRLMLGSDMSNPENRPPDTPWTWNEFYLPFREKVASLGISDAAFAKVTWENGARLLP